MRKILKILKYIKKLNLKIEKNYLVVIKIYTFCLVEQNSEKYLKNGLISFIINIFKSKK